MKNKNKIEEIDLALLDVRKAYRLLFVFQSRVLDIMHNISSLTNRRYGGGWSTFSNASPKDGKGNLNNWAWDWLNMYCYEFYFGKGESGKGEFAIRLVSDTGYFDNKEMDDKLEIDSFADVSSSVTKLVFTLGKEMWHPHCDDFEDNFIKDAPFYFRQNLDKSGCFIANSYPMSDFINIDKIKEVLLDFQQLALSNGFSKEDFGVLDSL